MNRPFIGLTLALLGAGCEKPAPAPTPTTVSDAATVAPQDRVQDATAAAYRTLYARLDRPFIDRINRDSGLDTIPEDTARMLSMSAELVDELVRITESQSCEWGVRRSEGLNAMLPHLSEVRTLARLLRLDARRRAEQGDAAGAAELAGALARLSGHAGKGQPSIIEHLVGTACLAMSTGCVGDLAQLGALGDEQKARLRRELEVFDPNDPMDSIATLTASRDTLAYSLRSNLIPADAMPGAARDWSSASQAERDAAARGITVLFDRAIAAWNGPSAEVSLAELTREAAGSGWSSLMPDLVGLWSARNRIRAELRKALDRCR